MLMHDFLCSDPDDMLTPLLAEKARYLKTDDGFVVFHGTNDYGDLPIAKLLCSVFSSVPGNNLVHTFRNRADYKRGEDAVLFDAGQELLHVPVGSDPEGMVLKIFQAFDLDADDLFFINRCFFHRILLSESKTTKKPSGQDFLVSRSERLYIPVPQSCFNCDSIFFLQVGAKVGAISSQLN